MKFESKELLWNLLGLIAIIGFGYYLGWAGPIVDMNTMLISWIPKLSGMFLVLFAVHLIQKFFFPVLEKVLKRRVKDRTAGYLMFRAVGYLLYFIALLLVIFFVFPTIDFALSFGLITAALALVLRDPLASIVAWFIIAFKHPIRIGDRVEIGNRSGDVLELTLFHIVMQEVVAGKDALKEDPSGRIIVIPNHTILSGAIINYTLDVPYVWDGVKVSITYESDLELAKELVLEATNSVVGKSLKEANEIIERKKAFPTLGNLQKDKPIVHIAFAESSIDLSVRYMVDTWMRKATRTKITEAIYRAFKKTKKVNFAYPHVHVVK